MKWFSVGLVLVLSAVAESAGAELMIELRETLPVPAGYPCIASITDLDGDGALDVVLWKFRRDYTIVEREGGAWGQGGSWVERFSHRPSPMRGLAVADADGDGTPEILSADYNSVVIHEATGDNVYEVVHESSGYGSFIENVRVGDSNGNGKLEFLIAQEGSPAHVSILEAIGDNTYANLGSVAGEGRNSWVTGTADLDLDGEMELVFGNDIQGVWVTYVFEDESLVYERSGFEPLHGFGDTDGDRRMEIIGDTNIDGPTADLRILENTGDNSFEEVLSVAGLYTPMDVNGDGQTELVSVRTGVSVV